MCSGKTRTTSAKQGMSGGTLFVEINKNLWDSDKTKIKIEVYSMVIKKLKLALLHFLKSSCFD